jgi:type I restriction enzyme S subunit
MANNPWNDMTLGDFVSLQRGHDLPASQQRPGKIPVMGSAGPNGSHDVAKAKGPGVVIGRSGVGSMGVVSYSRSDFWPHNTVLYVTDFKGNDERFAYYFLSQLDLRRYNSGSAQASLNRNFIYPIPIRVPTPSVQRRIAEILGTLDDKIQLNRRMNETLETMVRRLFKSWFVDFAPVHAKAALRREHPKLSNADLSRRALPNMAPEIAELFPDEFEESTIGLIPKGWKLSKLLEHVEASKGLSYKGSGLADSGMPMHNLNSVYEGGGYKFEGIKFYNGEFKPRHIIKPGEVLVANTEQGHDCLLLGYAAIVPDTFGDQGLYSHHTYRLAIREKSSITPEFLCRLLNSPRMHEIVSGFGNGTTVNMLPIDGVEQPEFIRPTKRIIDEFSSFAYSSRARQMRFVEENNALARTRDNLLPRLVSGELSVTAEVA